MAISAKFLADFTDFDRGAKSTEATLLTFEQAADRAGGRLMDLGTKGETAVPRLGGLTSSLHTFDGALAAMGIHIGPEIKALGELGEASGQTASQLGLVGTAGLALAAGIGGWNLGRAAMEFFGLDKAVEHAWTSLLNFNSATAEGKAAQLDAMALASKRVGHEVTTMSEAIAVNKQWSDDWALAHGRTTSALHDTMVAVAGWQKEIRTVRSNGDFEQLTADMESQNFSLQTLSTKYGIHVEALQYLQRGIAQTAKVQAEADAAAKKSAAEAIAAQKEAIEFQSLRWKQQLDLETKILASTASQTAAYLALTNEGVLKEAAAQRELNGVIATEETAMDRLNAAQKALQDTKIAGFPIAAQEALLMKNFGEELQREAIAEEAARFKAQGLNAEVEKLPALAGPAESSVLGLGSAAQQAGNAFLSMDADMFKALVTVQTIDAILKGGAFGSEDTRARERLRLLTSAGITSMATGGPVTQDGPIYAHAGEYVVPKGGMGGPAVVVNNVFHLVDTESNLTRRVAENISRSVLQGKKLASA